MAKKLVKKKNLPEVSKQTAGGIGGAVLGGIVAGPVGAIAGGIAGAMVGNASAEGKEPVKNAVASMRNKLKAAKGAKALASVKKALPAPKKSKSVFGKLILPSAGQVGRLEVAYHAMNHANQDDGLAVIGKLFVVLA
jgi:hypothetical protein